MIMKLIPESWQMKWEELMWQASPEHREMVTLRLAAHEKAVKEGYPSPYIDPENYDSGWNPIRT